MPLKAIFTPIVPILTGLLFNFFSVFAQTSLPARFEHLSVKDGLSNNNVRAIMQDRYGYMWFGTYAGINRFDGYSFKSYQFNTQDTNTIGGNHVIGLCEDHNGFIWAAISGGGLTRIDPRTDKTKRYTANPKRPNWLHINTVTAVRSDRFGNLWVGTIDGLYHFDPQRERFTQFNLNLTEHNALSKMISAIVEDREGFIWVGVVSGGLSRITINPTRADHPSSFGVINYRHNPADSTSLASDRVMALTEDHTGALWVGTYAGLQRFDKRTGRCTAHFQHTPNKLTSLSNDQISRYGLSEDKQGNLWVGTVNGLNCFNPERTRFARFYYDPQNPNSLATNTTHAIYTDRTGIVWISTNDAGVNRFDPNHRQIAFFSGQPGSSVRLQGYNIRSICGDTLGHLWIGTEGGGIFRYDRKSGQLISYRDKAGLAVLNTNFIGAFLQDREGQIWIGPGSDWTSSTGNLSRLNPATGLIQRINLSQTGQPFAFVMALHEDRQGNIWIGTGNAGLICYNNRRHTVTSYPYNPGNPTQLSDSWSRVLAEDRQGHIWIGTNNGLNRLDPKTGRFQHFFNDPRNPKSLAHNEIHSLCFTRSGQLWVGTDGGGLCLFHPDSETFSMFSEKDGLPDNAVQNILEDNDGNLWINTNRGLCRFSIRTRQFTNFNLDNQQENYLISGNLSTGACYKADDGTLFFGGKNGFIQFHPHSLRFNPNKPPVVITSLRLFDKLLPGNYDGQTLTLNHDQNSLTFEFAALNFTSSEKNQYTYQLENFDPTWVYAGTRRSVTYTNLPPGTYTFRVRGSNNDGAWNQKGTFMTIVIQPAWWQTIWFRGLLGLAIVGIIYGFYQYRLAELRRIQTMRDQISRDLHDDVGGILSGISFYSEAASAMQRAGRYQDSYELLQKIADNARTTIERMSDVVWSMRSDTNNALQFVERLENFSRELLTQRNIRLLVETEPGIERLPMSPAVVRNFYLIAKEAIHNAAKHSGATEVQLSLRQRNGKLALRIQDNGRGFSDSELQSGNGLDSMRKRAEAIRATYHLQSQPNEGTNISVTC